MIGPKSELRVAFSLLLVSLLASLSLALDVGSLIPEWFKAASAIFFFVAAAAITFRAWRSRSDD